MVCAQGVVGSDDDCCGTVNTGQFIKYSNVFDVTQPCSPVFCGEGYAHQTQFRQSRQKFARKVLGFAPFHDVRADFLLSELPHGSLNFPLYLAQVKVQWSPLKC